MAGLPGLPPPGFSEQPTEITIGMSNNKGLEGLPPPGFSEQQKGFFGSMAEGASQFLPNLMDALSSVPSGVSNIYDSITSPKKSLEDGTMETVARGIGGISSGVAGAGVGAMAGAPLAPFTLGLSVPVGAALGGAAGLLGFNKLNQATGSDVPTTPQEDMALLGNATGQGLTGSALLKALSIGAKGASKIGSKLSSNFDDAAQASTEKALGVQYGDRVKGLNRANLYLDDAGNPIPYDQIDDAASIQAPIQKQIDVIKQAGFLDEAPNNPDALKIHLDKGRAQIGQSIQRMINEGDSVIKGQEPLPDFSKAREYINSFRDSTKAELTKEFNTIVDDYISEPGSGFKKLAKFNDKLQKETNFDQTTKAESTKLKRFASYDLRKFTEKLWDEAIPEKAGEWAKANEQFSALSGLGKTLNKRMAKAEPGFISTLTTPVGSGPFIGAGGIGSAVLGTGAALPAAGAAWLARALVKSTQNAKPLTYSKGMESLSSAAKGAVKGLDAIAKGSSEVAANSSILGSLGAGLSSLQKDPSLKSKPSNQPDQSTQRSPLKDPASVAARLLPRDSKGRFVPIENASRSQMKKHNEEKQSLMLRSNSALEEQKSKGTAKFSSSRNANAENATTQAKIRNALLDSSNELKSQAKKGVKMANLTMSDIEEIGKNGSKQDQAFLESKTIKYIKEGFSEQEAKQKAAEDFRKTKNIEAKIDADPIDSTIFEMESGRNWKAKNPTSSASGGFQLIKSTAKALGVSDPFDPEQNYQGYLKLREEYSRLAKKPEDFYAVHYLGAPTFKKWKNGDYLTEQQQEQVDYLENKLIPKFKRIYAEKIKAKAGIVEA